MKRTLYITVSGQVATGKSTIAHRIKDSLITLGFKNVQLQDNEDKFHDHAKRFCSLVLDEDLHIVIKTQQVSRRSFS
jgi:deoxyadenosine/deoxycytidine kinase